MITIFFSVTVKAERQTEFEILAREMTVSTKAQDQGCIAYTFYRRADQPRDFVLYEQWHDAAALSAHLTRLHQVLGPPDDREPYPETHHRRRLPKAFLALLEKTDAVRYEVLE
jgi:quinol monooxygenase YgiN